MVSSLGVALSATNLVVAAPHAMRIALEPQSDTGAWPTLTDALRTLATRVGGAGTLSIALSNPLASTRTIDLPPLRERDAEQLLSRTAARYFVAARGPQIIAVAARGAARAGSVAPSVVTASPLRLLTGVHLAARDAGWAVQSVVPEESAWLSAFTTLWPTFARQRASILVLHADHTVLLLLAGTTLVDVRQFRAGALDASAIAATVRAHAAVGGGAIGIGVIGAPEQRKTISRALSAIDSTIQSTAPAVHDASIDDPAILAAAFATRATTLVLRTDDERAQRERRAQRIAITLAGAAALMLLVAGAFAQWGISRELAAVQRERASLKQQLSTTLVGRTSVETAYRQLTALNDAERSASHWSPLLSAIAMHLNENAYVMTFRGRGDSVVVDGSAARASTVFDELAQTPGLTEVRAAAPVRREVSNDGEPSERFTIAARLLTSPPKTVTTAPAGSVRAAPQTPPSATRGATR